VFFFQKIMFPNSMGHLWGTPGGFQALVVEKTT
jgi:hypothetical protein